MTMADKQSFADERRVRELFDQGYTIFERAYSEEEIEFFRAWMMKRYTEVGRPALRANPPYRPDTDVEIGPAGIIFHKITKHYPEAAARLYKRDIIDTIRRLLGDDMYLELPAGVLSDSTRPFFDWHTHIDGVDDAYYDGKRVFTDFERSQRVTHLLYLTDLSEENGQLLVLPRKITDPTAPPFDPSSEHWEGQVEIDCPAGSVVVLEQATWHAARRQTSSELRGFVGSYFAAGDVKATPLSDSELADWQGEDELFRSILPRG